MRKYEILRKDVEIKFADRKNINCGCAVGVLDVVPETIKSFDTLEDAEKELSKYNTRIWKLSNSGGAYFAVSEYYIESNEYDSDGLFVDSDGVKKVSDMKIEVIEKSSYKTVFTCSAYEEAEKFISDYAGDNELFMSFL
jgi:hypothetical protein